MSMADNTLEIFVFIPVASISIIWAPTDTICLDIPENAAINPLVLLELNLLIAVVNELTPLISNPAKLDMKLFRRLAEAIELEIALKLVPETDSPYAFNAVPIDPTLKFEIPLVSKPAKPDINVFSLFADVIEDDTVDVSIPETLSAYVFIAFPILSGLKFSIPLVSKLDKLLISVLKRIAEDTETDTASVSISLTLLLYAEIDCAIL